MNLNARNTRLTITAIALTALLAACGATQQAVNRTPGPIPGPQPGPTPDTSKAMTATVTLDAAHAGSEVITIAGGSISVAGGDGNRYELVVPAGALAEDTTITVTPLARLDGTPLSGGLVAGVKLEPDGLRFGAPVKLTVEPARDVPPGEQVAFGFRGEGSDFHLVPLKLGTPKLVFDLLHFSGYGIAQGTAAERAAVVASTPSDAELSIEQRAAEIVALQRARELAGLPADPDYLHQLQVLTLQYYQERIQPDMQAALTSCYAAANAIPRAVAWERMVEMFGLKELFADEISTLHRQTVAAVDHCWSEMTQPCVLIQDRAQVQVALGLVREAHLTAGDTGKYSLANVKACAWEGTVTINSVTTENGTSDNGMVSTSNDSLTAVYTIKARNLRDALESGENSTVQVKADHSSSTSETLNTTTSVGCPSGLGISYTTVSFAHQLTTSATASMNSSGGGSIAAHSGKLSISLYPGAPIPETTNIRLYEKKSGTCGGKDDYTRDESSSLEGEMIVATADFVTDIDPNSGTSSGSTTREVDSSGAKTVTTTSWDLKQNR